MIFTRGEELATSITNIFIFISSLYFFIKLYNKNNKLWKMFYFLMILNSFMGIIIHGVVLNITIKKILWLILSFLFTFTINTLYAIFNNKKKPKIKNIIFSSAFIYLVFVIEIVLKKDFLPTFLLYALIMIIIILIKLFKSFKDNKLIIIGFIFQIIGGIFLIFKIKYYFLDKNGIYHLFMLFTLIFFYLGINKKLD